jgi:translation initiation factor 2B subunit (eIF-2B alpha/beta/delta family)
MQDENQESVEIEESQAVAPAESEGAEEKQKAEAFAKKSDDQDRNWKETRRKMQELERKAREQEELIQRLSTPKAALQDDELDKLGDEDIVTKAQAKKLAAKMAEEIAQRVIKQREDSTVEERLSNKFEDFNQVVTRENIELLKETEPELAMSLSQNTDPYLQGVAAYKLMKRLGIGGEDMPKEPTKEKKKALENSQKPLSVNAVTKTSAIGNAHMFENGLTKELKKQLQEEMRIAIRGR